MLSHYINIDNHITTFTLHEYSNALFQYISKTCKPYLAKKRIATLSENIAGAIIRILSDVEKNKTDNNLADIFDKCLIKYGPHVTKAVVLAVEEFIDSRNFNFAGKYNVTNMFFNQVKYLSVNKNHPVLKYLNETLNLIKHDCETRSINSSHTGFMPSTFNTNTENNSLVPWKAMFLVLLASFPGITLTRTIKSEGFDDYYATNKIGVATTLDMLGNHYHEITNADPSQVRIRVFLEEHINYEHHQLKKKFIPLVANKNDILLFEGFSSMLSIPCENFCIVKKEGVEKLYPSYAGPEYLALYTEQKEDCYEHMEFNDYVCYGADDQDAIDKTQFEYNEYSLSRTELSSLNGQKNILVKAIQHMQELIREIDTNNAINTDISNQMQNVLNGINHIIKYFPEKMLTQKSIKKIEYFKRVYANFKSENADNAEQFKNFLLNTDQLLKELKNNLKSIDAEIERLEGMTVNFRIAERNKNGIINALEDSRVKNHNGTVSIFYGASHFLKMSALDPTFFNSDHWRETKEGDPQHEVREHLKQYPYWIGFPKK